MAPSTPPPPRRLELAAFTIASTVSRVMSPRARSTLVLPKRRIGTRLQRAGGRPGCRGRGARSEPRAPLSRRLLRAQDGVLRRLGHHELEALAGRDLDRLPGLGVPPHPRLVTADDELPDPRDREAVLGLLVGQGRESLEVGRRGLLVERALLGQGRHDLRLCQRLCCHRVSLLHESRDVVLWSLPEAPRKRLVILHGFRAPLSSTKRTWNPFRPRRTASKPRSSRVVTRSARGRLLFADREYRLARPGEAQFLAGEALDRAGVRLEGRDLDRQAGVLGPQQLDLPPERLGALALRDHAQEAAVSEERADHQGDEGDQGAQGGRLLPKADFVPRAILEEGQELIFFFNNEL